MSSTEIDDHVDTLEEPKKTTLAKLRDTIMEIEHHPHGTLAHLRGTFLVVSWLQPLTAWSLR